MADSNDNSGFIPVIDISGDLPENDVAKQLVDAAATYGFVYIRNLGKDIPVEAVDNIFELSKKFFSSPIEEKQPCKIQENNRGWVGMHAETLDTKNQRIGDFKEAMNLGEFQNGKAQQPLPPTFIAHESELDQFQKYCHSLMLKILVLFGIGLEVSPPTYFSTRHIGTTPSSCTLRLLHYPPLSPTSLTTFKPSVDIRAGAHTDYGSITLLFQRPSQPGLEILPPSPSPSPSPSSPSPNKPPHSNTSPSPTTLPWTPVPVFPPGTESDPSPPILVNIGDLLSHWTNNLLKSTVHRVIFPQKTSSNRYSIAYFGHPIGSTVLEAVPSERVRLAGQEANGEGLGEKTRVKAITADEHLMSRLKATYLDMYKDGGEKVKEVIATS